MEASFPTQDLRRWSAARISICAALAVAMCCCHALGQSGAGSIQGTVTDHTGAVIPGATIHVVNQATNVAIDTKTNKVGFYQVPGLNTGPYVLTITAAGDVETYSQNLDLQVSQTFVADASLTTGAVTTKVTVVRRTPLCNCKPPTNGAITYERWKMPGSMSCR